MITEGVEVIFKGTDQVSNFTKKIIADLEKMGLVGKKSGTDMDSAFDKAKKGAKEAGEKGKEAFDKLTESQKRALREAQTLYSSLRNGNTILSQTVRNSTYLGQSLNNWKPPTALNQGLNQTKNSINNIMQYIKQADTTTNSWASKVRSTVANAWDNVRNKIISTAQTVGSRLNTAIESTKAKIAGVQDSLGGLGQAFTSVFGALGLGSITQMTIGLALGREQMSALMGATMGSAKAGKNFVDVMDDLTNNSLVGLDQLGNSMSSIKMVTGMTNDQLYEVLPTVNEIGQRALLMGKDIGSAQEIMSGYGRGLLGDFEILKNVGISTKKQLMDLGWSGAATDVEGYNEAMKKALARGGKVNNMMNTLPGLIQVFQKGLRVAGRQIGEFFTPFLRGGLEFAIWLNKTNPMVLKFMIITGALVSTFALLLPVMIPILSAFQTFLMFTGLIQAREGLLTLAIIRRSIAEKASAISTAISNRALALSSVTKTVAIGQAEAHAGAIATETGAKNTGILATIRNIGIIIRESAVKAYNTATTYMNSASQYAQNTAKSIYAFLTSGSVIATISETLSKSANTVATWANNLSTSSGVVGKIASITATTAEGTATSGSTIAKIAGTVATYALAGATALLNVVMSANPIAIVIIAIVVLVGLLWHLYNTNTAVRNALNGVWSALSQVGGVIYGALLGAWNALVGAITQVYNALKPFIQALQNLGGAIVNRIVSEWSKLINALAPIGRLFSAIGVAISSLFNSFNSGASNQANSILSQLGGLLMYVANTLGTYLMPILKTVANFVGGFFTSVWTTFAGVLGAVSNFILSYINILTSLIQGNISFTEAMGQMWVILEVLVLNVINSIMQGIGKFIIDIGTNLLTGLTNAWNGFLSFLAQIPYLIGFALGRIVAFIISLPQQIYNGLLLVLTTVLLWGTQLRQTAVNTGVGFVNGLINFIVTLPQRIYAWLMLTIGRVIIWATMMRARAVATGRLFITGVLNFIRTLPGRIWTYLTQVIPRIVSAGASWVANARSKAQGVVNGVISYLSSLPGRVMAELNRVAQNILSAGSSWVANAKSVASNMLQGFLDGLGIHSPGHMAENTKTEMQRVADNILNAIPKTVGAVSSLASKMSDSFSPNLGVNNVAIPNVAQPKETATTVEGNNPLQSAFNQEETQKVQIEVDKTQGVVSSAFKVMNDNVSTKLDSIVKKDNTSWKKVNSVTTKTMSSLRKTTSSTVSSMNSAWGRMRSKINSEAGKIKTVSSGHINTLSSNVGSFYRRLNNPTSWFAGSPTNKVKNRSTYVGKLRTGFAGGLSNNKALDKASMLDWDFCKDGCFAGGWDFADKNSPVVKSKVHNFKANIPQINSTSLFARDFQTARLNPKPGNIGMFEDIWKSVVKGSHYAFYFNSKHGSSLDTVASGAYNCYDGALMTIDLANKLGYSASMVHGHWGSIPHVAASVNGRIFDTTQMQNRGVPRGASGVSFGNIGSSSKNVFDNMLSLLSEIKEFLTPEIKPKSFSQPEIDNLVSNNDSNFIDNTPIEITFTIKDDRKKEYTVTFDGDVPEGMSKDDVKGIIEEVIENKKLSFSDSDIDNIVKKINKKIRRTQRGLG